MITCTFISSESDVIHMEMDKRLNGNILFSDGASLKTTNGISTKTIAGQANNAGYTEGNEIEPPYLGFMIERREPIVPCNANQPIDRKVPLLITNETGRR